MNPNEVRPEHVQQLLKRIYQNSEYLKTIREEKYRKRLLKVGNLVRISKTKGFLSKEAVQKWTLEMFKIRKVERQNFPITYLLTDLNDEDVLGSFYREELQQVS